MKTTWTTWMLAGALAASLQWNLSGDPAPAADPPHDCSVEPAALGLDGEQAAALDRLCRADCAQASRLEAEARAALGELYAAMADPELDPAALRARVAEVSAARERALQALLDAVLEVRAVLRPDQVRSLLGTCCLTAIPDADGMPACAPGSNRSAAERPAAEDNP